MNSIRPFATVMILVVIGIGLYMVINSSDPIPPEEAADAMLTIPEIEEDLAALVDEGTFEPYAGTGPGSPFPPGGEMTAPPQWSPPAEGSSTPAGPDPNLTSSAPPLPEEAPVSPFPHSARESLPSAEQNAAESRSENAFSAQLQTQVEGATTPVSMANPHIQTASVEQATAGNIPSAAEVQALAAGPAEPGSRQAASSQDPYSAAAAAQIPGGPAGQSGDGTAALPGLQNAPSAQPATTFSVAWQAVQESLRRGELSQALLMLSEFYGDPQLTSSEQTHLESLLSQLAGTVIYSTSHELEQPHRVKPGETLAAIAEAYNVTPELLAKINGVADPNRLAPGTELKVVRGPFHAVIEQAGLRLVLDGRYAGRFPVQGTSAESPLGAVASWTVQQKVPAAGGSMPSQFATSGKHLVLVPAEAGTNAPAVAIIGDAAAPQGDSQPVVRVSQQDLADIYDILTIGSRVTVRR